MNKISTFSSYRLGSSIRSVPLDSVEQVNSVFCCTIDLKTLTSIEAKVRACVCVLLWSICSMPLPTPRGTLYYYYPSLVRPVGSPMRTRGSGLNSRINHWRSIFTVRNEYQWTLTLIKLLILIWSSIFLDYCSSRILVFCPTCAAWTGALMSLYIRTPSHNHESTFKVQTVK